MHIPMEENEQETIQNEDAPVGTEMMEERMNKRETLSLKQKIITWYKKLPDKKIYLEFITALLTIPVLLTVIISNLNNIKKQTGNEANATPTPAAIAAYDTRQPPKEIITTTPLATATPAPTPSAQCKKEVGPISIVYPEEGDVIANSPVCIDISRTGVDYCAVVWSYRINNESWSDYTDKSICLYGLTAGAKKFELRVKSIVTGSETILTRNFIVEGSATPTPISTSSATLTN